MRYTADMKQTGSISQKYLMMSFGAFVGFPQ